MSDPEFVPGFTRRKGAPGYNLEEKRRRTSSKVQLMEMKGDNDLDQVDLDKETVKDEEKEKGEKEEGGGGGRIKKKTEVKPDGEGS